MTNNRCIINHKAGKLCQQQKKQILNRWFPPPKAASGEAINALVHAMRPTVEMIAMKYIHSPLEKDDLVQEGMIGLLAALRESPTKTRCRFSHFCRHLY